MKEAIGGYWIYGIVLLFIVFFTTFVSVSTNYSRCYRIKDELVLNIEHYKGINQNSIDAIKEYLNGIGYSAEGKCPEDGSSWHKFSLGNNTYASSTNFCISKHVVIAKNDDGMTNGPIGHPESAYYSIAVFFRLDWPIFRQFFTITISGESSIIQMPKDDPQYAGS